MSVPLPRPAALLGAGAGLLALGACAAVGVPDAAPGPFVLTALGAAVGAVALSTPTLLVAGELLGHPATPAELAAAPLDAFVRVGRIALWLGPVLLFFATAGNAASAWAVAAAGLGVVGVFVGARGILATAPSVIAPPVPPDAPANHPAVPLALGWAVLAGALALHLASRLWAVAVA